MQRYVLTQLLPKESGLFFHQSQPRVIAGRPIGHPPLAHLGRLRSSLMTTGPGLIRLLTGSFYLFHIGKPPFKKLVNKSLKPN